MIVVTAASGALGRLVVGRLLGRCPADRIVAAVRDPGGCADLAARGITVRLGDYDDPSTLRTAFRGADRLLLISSPELDPDRRVGQHRNAVDAARAAGVGSVIYTSFLGADTQADGFTAAHHATERLLAACGLPHTVLRHPSTARRSSTRVCAPPSSRASCSTAPAGAGSTPPSAEISPRPPSEYSPRTAISAVPTTSPASRGPTAGSPGFSATSRGSPSCAGTGRIARPVPRAGWRTRCGPAPWSGGPAICDTSWATRRRPWTERSPRSSPRPRAPRTRRSRCAAGTAGRGRPPGFAGPGEGRTADHRRPGEGRTTSHRPRSRTRPQEGAAVSGGRRGTLSGRRRRVTRRRGRVPRTGG